MSIRLGGFRIRGFGPFDTEFAVDLSALAPTDRLVAICGENGAGKTTALELCLPGAMYRSTPTRGSLVDLATTRDAFLESTVINGQAWTIRHLVDKVSGKSEALVLDADGVPALPDSKVRSFDAWSAKHMPAPEVFFASVFAPQGAGGFLGAKPSERKEILLRILGPEMQRLELDAEQAREQLRAAKAAIATLDARIADERSRGGDPEVLAAEVHRLRMDVEAAALARVAGARSELEAAEGLARQRAAAEAAYQERVAERQRLTAALVTARDAVTKAEARVAANKGLLVDAAAIRAAVERLPGLVGEMSAKRAAVVAAEADVTRYAKATADAARAQAAAEQRHAAAQQRVDRATEARARVGKLDELRGALATQERLVQDHQESLDRLRGKRLAGAEDRIELLRGTLETIASGEEDPAGLAQDRLDRDDEQVQEARDLPNEIRAYEEALRTQVSARDTLARDVRNAEGYAEIAAGLEAAKADAAAALADVNAAATARTEGGEQTEAASNYKQEDERNLRALETEHARVTPLAAKAEHLANAKVKLAEREAELSAATREVARLEAELGALPEERPLPLAPDLARARAAVTDAEDTLAAAHRLVATTEAQLEQARASASRVAELDAQRADAEAELADWSRLAADLGKDGLQAMVIDGAIPEINELTNDLLHAAFGPRFTVEVRTQASDAKGKRLLETLDVWVIDTGTPQHKGREGLAETFSGGEKTILAEALSLALTQLACRLSGADRPTLIRDESAGQLSEGNAPIWMAMLRRAADLINVDRILFVNHDRQTWELADHRIWVGAAP